MPRLRDGANAHGEIAQGLIEFAILGSLLITIFLGLVDFSRFLYYDNAIRNASRTGAESAMEYCSSSSNCAQSKTPMTDDVIVQATVCESQQIVTLQPQISASQCAIPCDPGVCANGSGFPSTATTYCTQDVCITGSQSPRVVGNDVTVYVGYSFQPISFPMKPFFTTRSCFPASQIQNESTTHTLCSQATGRVL